MLSRDDNELLCRVGPGTPMGDLMRQYWIPAALSSELPEPEDQVSLGQADAGEEERSGGPHDALSAAMVPSAVEGAGQDGPLLGAGEPFIRGGRDRRVHEEPRLRISGRVEQALHVAARAQHELDLAPEHLA